MSKSHIYVLLHLGLFRNFCEHILKYNAEFNDLQEKESNICVRMGNLSAALTICHHFVSLLMPNINHQDGFFYPTLNNLEKWILKK